LISSSQTEKLGEYERYVTHLTNILDEKLDLIQGKNKSKHVKDASNYECIFTYELMDDPVATTPGYSYERKNIMDYVQRDARDPQSRKPINPRLMIQNKNLKRAIEYYKSMDSETPPHSK